MAIKVDLGVRQELLNDLRQVAHADGVAARVVDGVAAFLYHRHPNEGLGDIVYVHRQAHQAGLGEAHRLTGRREGDALHMVGRAANFVWPGNVGRTDARDRHAVDLVELLGLELVEPLVHGVLAGTVHGVVFVDGAVSEVGLLAADGDGTGIGHPVDSRDSGSLEAVIHA